MPASATAVTINSDGEGEGTVERNTQPPTSPHATARRQGGLIFRPLTSQRIQHARDG